MASNRRTGDLGMLPSLRIDPSETEVLPLWDFGLPWAVRFWSRDGDRSYKEEPPAGVGLAQWAAEYGF